MPAAAHFSQKIAKTFFDRILRSRHLNGIVKRKVYAAMQSEAGVDVRDMAGAVDGGSGVVARLVAN
jgi:hypothetical protein